VKSRHHREIIAAMSCVAVMIVFSCIFPYLYNVLCQKTGIDGKALRQYDHEGMYKIDVSRQILLEFDANADRRRQIEFYPSLTRLNVHPGEPYTLVYHLVNQSSKTYVLQAIPSMTPPVTSKFLKKLECFCFQPQVLKPYEHRILPLKIIIDPEIPTHIHTMTLSYALFEMKEWEEPS